MPSADRRLDISIKVVMQYGLPSFPTVSREAVKNNSQISPEYAAYRSFIFGIVSNFEELGYWTGFPWDEDPGRHVTVSARKNQEEIFVDIMAAAKENCGPLSSVGSDEAEIIINGASYSGYGSAFGYMLELTENDQAICTE